jgi:hypothetical protein
LTVFLKHDQSKNLDELNRIQEESGFWGKFPPDGPGKSFRTEIYATYDAREIARTLRERAVRGGR